MLDMVNQMHLDMNNILDWGLSKRRTEVIEHCGKIHELQVVQPKPKRMRRMRRP